jgi:hypothetical protein
MIMQPIKRSAPAPRMAALHHFTLLEEVVIISVSMLDRLCNRVEFPRAFAYLNTMSKRKFRPKAGGNPPAASLRYPGEQAILLVSCIDDLPTSDHTAPLLQRRMTANRQSRGETPWRVNRCIENPRWKSGMLANGKRRLSTSG